MPHDRPRWRVRISTLMLVVVIVALALALVVERFKRAQEIRRADRDQVLLERLIDIRSAEGDDPDG